MVERQDIGVFRPSSSESLHADGHWMVMLFQPYGAGSFVPTPHMHPTLISTLTHCSYSLSLLCPHQSQHVGAFQGLWLHCTLVSSSNNPKPLRLQDRQGVSHSLFFSFLLNFVSPFFLRSVGFPQSWLSGYFMLAATCDFLLCICQIISKSWGEWGMGRYNLVEN
jgi:hypothetical protein